MMSSDEFLAAADAADMDPLQYSHMIMGDQFLDDELERRVFNPLYLRVRCSPTVKNLTSYEATTGLTHTKYTIVGNPEPRIDKHTIVVQVDGACKNNGKSNAEAAIGVYFGPLSAYNFSARVPAQLSQTNQVAELYSVIQALERIKELFRDEFSIGSVYIVTDSRYVVEGLSEHIMVWRENGYKNSKKKKVVNHEEIRKLDMLMQEMAEDGLETAFWSVSREENSAADTLAKDTLGLCASSGA